MLCGINGAVYSYFRDGKWDLALTVNGFLAGLVAITCPCYWVDPEGAFLLGIGAGFVVVCRYRSTGISAYRRSHRRGSRSCIWPVSGARCRLGLFAAGKYGAPTADWRRYQHGGDRTLLWRRLGSSLGADDRELLDHDCDLRRLDGPDVCIKYAFRLRIPTEGEIEGLDIHEHGFPAYPEYVVTGEDGARRRSTKFRLAGVLSPDRTRSGRSPKRNDDVSESGGRVVGIDLSISCTQTWRAGLQF